MAEEIPQDIGVRLSEISEQIYGGKACFRLVNPRRLRLLTKNARFMKKETFSQLTKNVTKDEMLSSIPLVHPVKDGLDYRNCPEEELEVISGNHRVKAAKEAGFESIVVLSIPHQRNEAKVAKQLSHNAISGTDDDQLLRELYEELSSIEAQLYSGLDSEDVQQLKDIEFSGFGAEPVRTEKIVLWFLPEEVAELDKILLEASEIASADKVYLVAESNYKEIFNAITKTKTIKNIANTAVAFMVLASELSELMLTRAKSQSATANVGAETIEATE
ncbi:ParB/Srx family N-terminal domain-containing protein [Planctomicrobium sp. SH668]|uniref:ParB/Srx family N-terminal domain-containing protein n=1 Tax=Planctomicrobium sp. SH668 TaxID=3448126 RepID=UPI003F5C84B8